MENNKKKNNNNAISKIAILGITFCFFLSGLFAVGHKPIREVNADQIISGNASGIIESNSMYRASLPFDMVCSYDASIGSTSLGGLDLNYYYHRGASISTPSPTVPSYSLTAIFLGNWNYSSLSNYLYFDINSSWFSDFNVECIDSYWEIGGLSYTSYSDDVVIVNLTDLSFSLSKPILVDPNSPDTNLTMVYSAYDSNSFCLKWTVDITYTLVYIDNNGEHQTVNVTNSDSTPESFQLGDVFNIMPALPSNANLNYPYMLYKYHLRMNPFSPNGNLTTLKNNYAVPLLRFNTYAYKTPDYRYLEYEFYDTNITIVNPVDNWVESIRSFFFDSIHGFLSTEILPGVSFYWILFICVGIPILIAILKIWLGG